MKFVCFGYRDATGGPIPAAEQFRFREESNTYGQELRQGGHWIEGVELQCVRQTAVIRLCGGIVSVEAGPLAEAEEQIGTVLILEARDLNHAIAIVSNHPGLSAGPFEIRPVEVIAES